MSTVFLSTVGAYVHYDGVRSGSDPIQAVFQGRLRGPPYDDRRGQRWNRYVLLSIPIQIPGDITITRSVPSFSK